MSRPETFIEIKIGDGIYINKEKVTNVSDLQQQATELLHNPMFEMMVEDAKTRGYLDGFLESKVWEAAIAGKAWYACAANMEVLLKQIIDFKEPMV